MAIDARKISDLDEQIKTKILGLNSNVPETEMSIIRANRIDLGKTLYTDFFPKNQQSQALPIQNANFKENQYTPTKKRKNDMISALLERSKKNKEFFQKNAKWSIDQTVLYLLGNKVWNPTGLFTATLPGFGGIVPSSITLVDAQQVRKFKDSLKKPFDKIYAGLFGSNQNTLAQQNVYSPANLRTKDKPTFNVNNNRIEVNYRQLSDSKAEDSTLLGVEGNKLDADGNVVITYDINTYIDDVDKDIGNKFKGYKSSKYTPNIPRDVRDLYDDNAQLLYFESNIKTGTDVNDIINLKKLILYCGLEDKPTESFTPSWVDDDFIGSSQAVHTYKNTSRSFELTLYMFADIFDIEKVEDIVDSSYRPISDLKMYKQKIDWILQHCYPKYNGISIEKGPLIYVTLGNLFQSLPCIITNLSIEWGEVWDLKNINSAIPILAKLGLSLTVVHTETPDNNYKFLTKS